MNIIYPDYYKDFKCIASACRHNCCIGWEIDIDSDTLEHYRNAGGAMGARLAKSISYEGEPHFILGENERCPFLNSQNLCDIIIAFGEEKLCTICAKHPRFENELPDRIEIGVGMACEEAARLILSHKEPVRLVGNTDTDDEIILLRDKVIALLQNREKQILERVFDMLSLCGVAMPEKSISQWAEILLSLERLDEEWTKMLCLLNRAVDSTAFDAHMQGRQSEYEQMLVYFVYRHFANSITVEEAALRAAFAALAYTVLHALGVALFEKNRGFTFEDQVELCRLFSSEIEYSDENLYILLDMFY